MIGGSSIKTDIDLSQITEEAELIELVKNSSIFLTFIGGLQSLEQNFITIERKPRHKFGDGKLLIETLTEKVLAATLGW